MIVLVEGIRTVEHLAGYLEELQAAARAFATRAEPERRGYFSPDEEVDARAILVSYWQARNALLEVVMAIRGDERLLAEQRESAFLTAYAAALLLIDAARFLRDVTHERPVVRRKLNEPAVEFGVPAGVYDSVQRSLVSARNAWHLYHAIHYYDGHAAELAAHAREHGLERVWDVIDRLRWRVDVSLFQFTSARWRTRTDQAWRRFRDQLVGRALYGLQKLGGVLAANKYLKLGHQPGLPADVAARLEDLLLPGDVLLVRKEFALTNYFLPGFWPHVALYLGRPPHLQALRLDQFDTVQPRWRQILDGGQQAALVLEAMKDGVRLRPLASPFASDSVLVLRPQLAAEHLAAGLARGLSHEGKPYDFDFDFSRSDRLVCSEVVYRSYDGVGGIHIPLTKRAGRFTLSGSDLVQLARRREHFAPVAAFAPTVQPDIQVGDDVEPLLETVMPESVLPGAGG